MRRTRRCSDDRSCRAQVASLGAPVRFGWGSPKRAERTCNHADYLWRSPNSRYAHWPATTSDLLVAGSFMEGVEKIGWDPQCFGEGFSLNTTVHVAGSCSTTSARALSRARTAKSLIPIVLPALAEARLALRAGIKLSTLIRRINAHTSALICGQPPRLEIPTAGSSENRPDASAIGPDDREGLEDGWKAAI